MFSFESFAKLNQILTGLYRIMWLNILWLVATVLGLVVFGLGPASYAVAAYIDRWFRHGETPPITRTFLRDLRVRGLQPMLVSWLLLGAGAVIAVNLMSVTNWYLRAANIGALLALLMITAYVYFVMAALDVHGIRRLLASAVLLGVGSLHLTIIGATTVAIGYALMFHFAAPLLLVLGTGFPAAVVGLIVRRALREIDESAPTIPSRRSTRGATEARGLPYPAAQASHVRKGHPA